MHNFDTLMRGLEKQQSWLCSHEIYDRLDNPQLLSTFMSYHVYAVWDFMSLLKALQKGLSCVDLPWRPVANIPKDLTRFVNEIVLAEESDVDPSGRACDHFSLYLMAMSEMEVETQHVESFIQSADLNLLPEGAREFVEFNLKLSQSSQLHKIAAAFFYGREKLIPEMFEKILSGLGKRKLECPTFVYYLERHIELDGDEHSVLAQKCLELLCRDDAQLWEEAWQTGMKSLELRGQLWDYTLKSYHKSQVQGFARVTS